jgi:predicted RNA-binding protein with PUA-like domain
VPRCWLFKSEADVFSISDLRAAPNRTTCWDGVRNYQARNFLRDQVRLGDLVVFYHSNAVPSAAVGIAEVVRAGYPDHTAFDRDHPHFDPDSDPADPTWFMVDIRHVQTFARPVTLETIKAAKGLAGMALLKQSRLSVTPVTAGELAVLRRLGGG